ncbi:TraR/DksA C4-type zinc finger protein [Microbacteriaceae bacterium VKM Ac-2855]|nr:TraR/DksA C4-type zinc finger protein [Microbacteriaceae bacterium VKM Ac-2855]
MERLPLTADQRDVLELELRERLAEVNADLARLDGNLAEVLGDRGDGTADDEHDPEGTPLSAEWSQLAGVRDERLAAADALGAALARIGSHDFGDCRSCGRPIGFARLEARPAAEFCIDCARAAERRARN